MSLREQGGEGARDGEGVLLGVVLEEDIVSKLRMRLRAPDYYTYLVFQIVCVFLCAYWECPGASTMGY